MVIKPWNTLLNYAALNVTNRMTMNQLEDTWEKSSRSIIKRYPRICMERLSKTMKILCKDRHSSFEILTRD